MHIVGRLLLISFAVAAAGSRRTRWRARRSCFAPGQATGPNAIFAFDRDAKPHRIVVRTTQVGSLVRGSKSSSIRPSPAFSHLFTTDECKFGDSGSKCEVIVPASNPAYGMILAQFKRGRVAGSPLTTRVA